MNKDLAKHTIRTLDGMSSQIGEALPAGVDLERFIRTAKNAIQGNPQLLEVRNGEPVVDRKSIFDACSKAAKDGLVLDGREAAIVVFKGTAQYMPMIAGLLKLARKNKEVATIAAVTVRERDLFEFDPACGCPPRHHVEWFSERGSPVGYYAVIHYRNGSAEAEVMGLEEINQVRSVARTDKVWSAWPERMAQKTVLRRLLGRALLDGTEHVLEADHDPITVDAVPPTEAVRPATSNVSQLMAARRPYTNEQQLPPEPEPEELVPVVHEAEQTTMSEDNMF